ncbi:glycosyltransferase family 4 protein [Paraclostridium dentum]|uniref:glycosyltransferase family 4 protein n=1 Tax=Paraclostridium dentum TaxID=2662455 RepID=UPI001472AEDB|nr:glycosyltransferase family 4 protein [Paraclostridium dentum]
MDYDNKRIMFIIGSMRRGGAERVISILANNYAKSGWDVDIITLLDDSNDYDLDSRINLKPIFKLGKSKFIQLPNWIFSIRRHVKDSNPDFIVSFIARINVITLISCLGLKKPIIVSERNDPKSDGRSFFVKISTYVMYNFANKVIFQTEWAKSCFPKCIQKNSIIIPNPVSVKVRHIESDSKKIVAVGRLEEQKNHSLLIDVFKNLSLKYPEYKLYIFGEGSLKSKLIKKVKNLNLENCVIFPGNKKNIHENIVDAEVFVLSSNYEGLSNALLEAMAMGIPCISTNCAGSNEIIIDEKNGLLVPIKSEKDLENAIERLILNKNLRLSLGENAYSSMKNLNLTNILNLWNDTIINS